MEKKHKSLEEWGRAKARERFAGGGGITLSDVGQAFKDELGRRSMLHDRAMKTLRREPTESPQEFMDKMPVRRRQIEESTRAADTQPEGRKSGGRLDKSARGGGKKWIQGAIKHPGALHKALHVPAGQKIPAAKLEKAAHSKNPTMRKRAALAKTLKGFK